MTPWEDILRAYRTRKRDAGPELARMLEIREHYQGDWIVPLPELDKFERPFVPNLIVEAIDQTGQRIASTLPDCFYPPLRPGIGTSEQRSRDRRKATLKWWQMSRLGLIMRRRARELIAYATSPVLIRPDFARGIPEWYPRDPLTTYPCPMANPVDMTPLDCIFCFTQPLSWIRDRYPESARLIRTGPDPRPDDRYELLEYVDGEEIVLGVLGKTKGEFDRPEWGQAESMELERTVNRAGVCTAVVPGRITLGRPQGQYDGLPGVARGTAKAFALWMIGVEKGIFADRVVEGRAGEEPNVVAGPFDGRSGKWTIVTGGQVKDMVTNPTYMAPQMIDRLERTQRLEGGIPSEYGGEAPTNVRTGRQGARVLSAVIDFPVQEAQEVLATSLMEEDRRAIAVAKGYFDAPRSFYVSWPGAKGRVDYTPSETFETDEHLVTFSVTGMDANNLRIATGQGIGTGTLSKLTSMKVDPLVADPEVEHDQIIFEGLETAIMGGIQQQLAAGAIPISAGARIMDLVRSDKMDLAKAVATVQQEAQQRQAAQAPPGSPETQPGIAQPGMGAEAGAAVPPSPPSVANLSSLLSDLRKPARGLQGAPQG